MSTARVETTTLDGTSIPAQGEPGQTRQTRSQTHSQARGQARETGSLAVVLDMRASRADARDERVVAGQRRRLDVQARHLGRLMERRPELRGAYAPADMALDGLLASI